ncbi:hypothetical protein ACE7GA_02165 [Roseomonas sp. CCTCC AB2023176]|uniref:hypothetical protein n=1 Tax=Roseomonas sp. CCTCC AB2023176 TaxID=3342640 RepID=UPI0035D5D336
MRRLIAALLLAAGPAAAQAPGAPAAVPPPDAAFCLKVARQGMACRAEHGDPITGNAMAFGGCMMRGMGTQDSLRLALLLERARNSWATALMECARR